MFILILCMKLIYSGTPRKRGKDDDFIKMFINSFINSILIMKWTKNRLMHIIHNPWAVVHKSMNMSASRLYDHKACSNASDKLENRNRYPFSIAFFG